VRICSGLDILVVQVDGIHISEHLVLVAALISASSRPASSSGRRCSWAQSATGPWPAGLSRVGLFRDHRTLYIVGAFPTPEREVCPIRSPVSLCA
jgi:hypothetical protein